MWETTQHTTSGHDLTLSHHDIDSFVSSLPSLDVFETNNDNKNTNHHLSHNEQLDYNGLSDDIPIQLNQHTVFSHQKAVTSNITHFLQKYDDFSILSNHYDVENNSNFTTNITVDLNQHHQ